MFHLYQQNKVGISEKRQKKENNQSMKKKVNKKRNTINSACQSSAAALVPYIDIMSFPHLFSSPGSVSSSSHNSTYMSLVVLVCVYAQLMSLNIIALGLFPVTGGDSSIRSASNGGVAANNPCVDLLCHQPQPYVHVLCVSFVMVNPISPWWVVSWSSRSTPQWVSFHTRSSSCTIPSPRRVPSSLFQGRVLGRRYHPVLPSALARSPPQLAHSSPCSRSRSHFPQRFRCSISLSPFRCSISLSRS